MPTTDPRIDAYIAKSADFAKPILMHLRSLVHTGCPDVVETMKWSFPHFEHHGVMCGMAAFKQHCTLGFWKGSLFLPKEKDAGENAMGQFGRITSVDDLPPKKVLLSYIKQAVKLNEEGINAPKAPKKKKAALVVPPYFKAALKKNKQALSTFDNFTPSQQRDYVEGSSKRSRRRLVSGGWKRPSSGSLKESRGIGSTKKLIRKRFTSQIRLPCTGPPG